MECCMDMTGLSQTELVQRNEESLRFITDRVCKWHIRCSDIEEQQILLKQITSFFDPEISEFMKYTGRLPSFRNCNGKTARMELLKQEVELVILEQMMLGSECAEDFESCMQRYRQAIRRKLLEYTQAAQRESYRVEVKRDIKTNENEKCTILSGKKDVTKDIINPNHENEDSRETEEDVMERNMGEYQPF